MKNRPHAPGLPGGVMGGLFVRRFFGFSEFSPLRLIAAIAGGAGEAVRVDLRRLAVFIPYYIGKRKNNPKKIIFYAKGVDTSQIPNYNIIKKRQETIFSR